MVSEEDPEVVQEAVVALEALVVALRLSGQGREASEERGRAIRMATSLRRMVPQEAHLAGPRRAGLRPSWRPWPALEEPPGGPAAALPMC